MTGVLGRIANLASESSRSPDCVPAVISHDIRDKIICPWELKGLLVDEPVDLECAEGETVKSA
jgi:hypothetical protein